MTSEAARGPEPIASGHRTTPHTADLVLEAWAPTKHACYEQAVLALVESFAEVREHAPRRRVAFRLDPAPDEELLVALLEEVVYVTDAHGLIPAAVHLDLGRDGGASGWFEAVGLDGVEVVGPAPKAVSRDELRVTRTDGLWRGRALVDV